MLGASALAGASLEIVPGMRADEIISEYGQPKGKAIGDNGRENWVYPQFLVRLKDREVVSVRHASQKGGTVTLTKGETPPNSPGWFTPAGRPLETQGIIAQLVPEAVAPAGAVTTPPLPAKATTVAAAKSPAESGKTPVRRVGLTANVLPATSPTATGEHYWNPMTFLTAVALVCAILALAVRIGGRKRHHPYRGAAPLPLSSAHSTIVKRPDLERTGQK